MFQFQIIQKDPSAASGQASKARVGKLITSHGVIDTPAFVPVGTKAAVKGLTPQDLKEIGVQIFFGNTYHLHLRPGEQVIRRFGGLGRFMGWDGVTITDSGGFQVFSLGQKKVKLFADEEETEVNMVNITDNGVKFRSHIDGSLHEFTPEKSIEIQKKLGADLILAFDECPPHPSTYQYTKEATERTHKWALRSLKRHMSTSEEPKATSEESLRNTSEVTRQRPRLLRGRPWQALFGIVQGGVFKDLRESSAKFISALPFDGIAIGGVSVGESKKEMRDVLAWVHPYLPDNKPRHLLGIGEIDDIFDAVDAGMDTFDCVIPTRFGRYGIVFVSPREGSLKNKFRIAIKKTLYAKDKGPLDKNCKCYVCKTFTRAYICHLFRSDELLAYRLASYHNLYFIVNLVKQIREAILEGNFGKMKKSWLL